MTNAGKIVMPNQKLLIIGNGFDLDLGLRTTYWDFAKSRLWPCCTQTEIYSLYDFLEKEKKTQKWIDLEVSLRKYAREPAYESKALYDAKIVKSMYDKLVGNMMEYLNEEFRNAALVEDSMAVKVLRGVIANGFYDSVYTFNYTSLSDIANRLGLNTPPKTIHIHGALKNKTAILGFDEDVEVHDKLKFMYKAFNPSYLSNTLIHDLSTAEEVVIFGHSLGDIDYMYFKDFFTSLVMDSKNRCNRRKVTIFTCDYDSRMEILTQLHRRKFSIEQITRLNDFNIICTHGADEGKLLDFLEYHDKMRRSDF